MRPIGWQIPAHDVAFFRDDDGTWFAAEVVHAARWSSALLDPLDADLADIRIAFLEESPARPPAQAPWLCLLPAAHEREPRLVVDAALAAWPHSPTHRGPGAPPEAYLVAGFQALCPPHPPCDPNPGMRDSLFEYLSDRLGPLGRVARAGHDEANRLLRVYWPDPEAFATEVLRERIRDDGGARMLRLADFLVEAEVAATTEETAVLAGEREDLLPRLTPLRYFTHPLEYDRAAAHALAWRERYEQAYRVHYREVVDAAGAVLADTALAAGLAGDLDALNRAGRPVGEGASRRLEDARAVLMRLPIRVDDRAAQTGGVVLGRMPYAIAEARLAAAAVLAALDVHRRRRTETAVDVERARQRR